MAGKRKRFTSLNSGQHFGDQWCPLFGDSLHINLTSRVQSEVSAMRGRIGISVGIYSTPLLRRPISVHSNFAPRYFLPRSGHSTTERFQNPIRSLRDLWRSERTLCRIPFEPPFAYKYVSVLRLSNSMSYQCLTKHTQVVNARIRIINICRYYNIIYIYMHVLWVYDKCSIV